MCYKTFVLFNLPEITNVEDLHILYLLVIFFDLLIIYFTWVTTSAVTEALMAPAQYPGCSGTRNLHDNLSDLRAQVAANQRGSQLVGELIDSYGLAVVQAYMGYIQVAARSHQNERKKRHFAQHRCSVCFNVAEQCRASSEGHAEGLCTPQKAADWLLGGGIRGFHGRWHANQTAGSD